MPVVPPGDVPPVSTMRSTIENSTDIRVLALKDYLDLYSANVNPRLTKHAERKILKTLRGSSVTVNTLRKVAWREETEYEHTYPVISRIDDPELWVAPRGRIIYEPKFDDPLRHKYYANQFKPDELMLTLHNRHPWTLKPDMEVSRYEVARNGTSDYIPVTNTTYYGPGDRFTIFHYFHDEDVRREYAAKIFYKKDGDGMRFHCVSIPIKLLSVLVKDGYGHHDTNDYD